MCISARRLDGILVDVCALDITTIFGAFYDFFDHGMSGGRTRNGEDFLVGRNFYVKIGSARNGNLSSTDFKGQTHYATHYAPTVGIKKVAKKKQRPTQNA